MVRCTACGTSLGKNAFKDLAEHFAGLATRSDPEHIGWLNRNLIKTRVEVRELERLFRVYFDYKNDGLSRWAKKRFIERFYGENLHPFVERLQNPSRSTLLGYVLEHQHFLRQWVKSLAMIVAKTDKDDVLRFELENITTEFGGHDKCGEVAHFELLIRMGVSQGLAREKILANPPLPLTKKCIEIWNSIARDSHWAETMLAMHGLELVANRNLRQEGATKHYFDPKILTEAKINPETKAFLREGYEADVHHSEYALKMVEKYGKEYDIIDDIQATFLRSLDVFDKYLMSRVHRAEEFD